MIMVQYNNDKQQYTSNAYNQTRVVTDIYQQNVMKNKTFHLFLPSKQICVHANGHDNIGNIFKNIGT